MRWWCWLRQIGGRPAQRRLGGGRDWEGTYGADEEPLDHGLSREVRHRIEASEVVAGSQDVVDAKRGLFSECLLAHLHNVDHLALVLLGRGEGPPPPPPPPHPHTAQQGHTHHDGSVSR